jgi:hypothetical protein
MRLMIILSLALSVVAVNAVAGGVSSWHEKPAVWNSPPAIAPDREGGDTVDQALVITELPFYDTGNTCGYADDYDAACYDPSEARDVVYSFTPTSDMYVDIDMCGSLYDTKVYVLDEALAMVACADDTYYDSADPCGQWNAALQFLQLEGGVLYYVVVDGWGADCGYYELSMAMNDPCEITYPNDAVPENEPPMQGVYDQYNAGCFSDWADPMSYILDVPPPGNPTVISGFSGYYEIPDDLGYDHDWWALTVGDAGVVRVVLEAQRTTNLLQFTLPGGDCDQAGFVQEVFNPPCGSNEITMTGQPGETLYFWVHCIYAIYPNGEYPYRLEVYNEGVTRTESRSWSDIKALYQ